MKFQANVWNQIKNLRADDLIGALEKDGWVWDITTGAEQIYRHPDGRRVSVHYQPGKTYRPKLLKSLLGDIGWTDKDLRRLKLIKRH